MRLNKQVLRRVTAILLAVMICCGDLAVPMQQVVAYATETTVIPEPTATQEPLPATETPATEVPVTEVPVTEVPATEVPVTEAPPAETVAPKAVPVPVTEVPATATPVPVTEVPATETPAPVTEVPATETPAPVTEAPATETPAPATEVPATETPAPATEVPATETPVPVTEVPATETPAPATEVPATETPAPVTEVPATETPAPATEVPATETPAPATEVPATETPAPATEVPATETPAPATEVPATETPVPVTEVPATETPAPATEVPATETPAPATEVPATETPAPAPEMPATEVPVTETPAPVQLVLSAGKSIYQLGETVLWTVSAENAETVSYTVTDQNGQTVASGDLNGSSVSYLPEASGVYTLAAVAAAGDQNGFASSSVTVEEANGYVTLTTSPRFAVVEHEAMNVQAAFDGGLAPYTVQMEITRKGEAVYTDESVHHEAGSVSAVYMPRAYGDHEVKVIVTDALGNRYSASSTVPVSANVYESEKDWEESVSGVRLTGDWRQDLVSVARTQLGVEESDRNFIIDEAGTKRGYTRYGHWYGSLYSEWCAMFISFCMRYADIPAAALPREAHVGQWRSQLRSMDVYEQELDQYVPGKGDLIFFDWDADGELEHVGIVTQVKDDTVYTIEGNSRSKVKENSYALSDERIAGYASMSKVMDRAGILEKFEQIDLTVSLTAAPTATPVPGDQLDVTVDLSTNGLIEAVYGYTNKPGVNVREKASVKSDRVEQIKQNTQVKILSRETVKDELWYFVDVEGKQGYILGDLLSLSPAIHISNALDCTCEAQPDEAGETVHAETCALYVAPEATQEPEVVIEITATEAPVVECTCEAQANEAGETVHAETCALYVAPEATQEPEVIIEITATEAPVVECTCEAQANEAGETVHAETCALYVAPEATQEPEVVIEITATEAPVVECTCEAQADENGETVHAETCALYVAPEATQEPEVVIEITATETPVVECTCEAQADENGETVHAETCALYVAPEATQEPEVVIEITATEAPVVECTCEAQPDENGETVHAETCALYVAPEATQEPEVIIEITATEAPVVECTCEAQADENGETVHAETCALYVAPEATQEPEMVNEITATEAPVDECTCEVQPDENGEIIHAEDCALNAVVEEAKESVCTCEAQPDENGEIIHAEDCVLNAVIEEAEESVCTCEAQPDENGEIIHAEDCELHLSHGDEELFVEESDLPMEEQIVAAVFGDEAVFCVDYVQNTEYQWQRKKLEDEAAEWQNIQDDAIAAGWNTHELHLYVTEENAAYQYRCLCRPLEQEELDLLSLLFGIRKAYAAETWTVMPTTFTLKATQARDSKFIYISDYGQKQKIKIYNWQYYTPATGDGLGNGGGNLLPFAGDAKSGVDILIGDQAETGNNSTAATPNDIKLSLQDKQNTVVIYPVYGGNQHVDMVISGAASFNKLEMAANAKLILTLNADLTIAEADLDATAQLTVNTNGYKLTVNQLNGGVVAFNGNGTVVAQNMNAAQLAVQNVTLGGTADQLANITSSGNIEVDSATVQYASLFGFDASATGKHEMVFTGDNKLTQAVVGAATDTKALVKIHGLNTISAVSNSSIIQDYTLTYQERISDESATVIEPVTGWLTGYRVEATNRDMSDAVIISGRASGTEQPVIPADGVFALPVYSMTGYTFAGWKAAEGDGVYTHISAMAEDLILTASLTPYQVKPTLLAGYTPDATTNDADNMPTFSTEPKVFGDSVELPALFRFGYDFLGWRVLLDGQPVDETLYHTAYLINNMTHLTAPAENEQETAYLLTLQAQWETSEYTPAFSIASNLGVDFNTENKIEISVKNNEWQDVVAFLKDNEHFVANNAYTIIPQNGSGLLFGETLDSWMQRLGYGYLPKLRLVDATANQTFNGWNSGTVTGESIASNVGDRALLALPANTTLKDYHERMTTKDYVVLAANFADTVSFTIQNAPSGWSFGYTELGSTSFNALELDANGNLSTALPVDATIYFRAASDSAKKLGISAWHMIGAENVAEAAYAKTDDYIEYTFQLKQAVTAMPVGSDLRIDLYKSPISFVREHTHNNITRDGFWYEDALTTILPIYKAADDRYFYAWDYGRELGVVTSQPTPNQLTLVDGITIGLHDCTMQVPEAFKTDAKGRTLDGKSGDAGLAMNGTDVYGNIVFNTDYKSAYTVSLKLYGTNTIGTMFQSKLVADTGNNTTVHVSGQNDENVLNLGSAWGILAIDFNDLTIRQLDTPSDFLLCIPSSGEGRGVSATFNNCTIAAPDKRILCMHNKISFAGCRATVGSVHGYSGVGLSANSFVHTGSMDSGYSFGSVAAGSTLIVEGDITQTSKHETSLPSINGTLIAKGNYCYLGQITTGSGSLVVANHIALGNRCNMNGQLFVNQITNPLSTGSSSHHDDLYLNNAPLSHGEAHNYNFTGSIYLFGEKYTAGGKATDESNPVSVILSAVLKTSGKVDSTAITDAVIAEAKAKAADNRNEECFVLGSSDWTAALKTAQQRTVYLTGNIYAAGNMTFFNDTYVTGTIECKNMLTSKQQLNITAGSVTAEGVGNAYCLTTEESSLLRYAKTVISGGTVKANKLGAMNNATYGESCSVVSIAKGAVIQPLTTGGTVQVKNVLYANYIGDNSMYTLPAVPDRNPRSLVFEGTVGAENVLELTLSNTNTAEENSAKTLVFAKPVIVKNNTEAQWAYDSINGPVTTYIAENGYVNGVDTEPCVYQDKDKFVLYAIQEKYPLNVCGEGFEGRFTVSAVGTTETLSDYGHIEVGKGSTVTIQLNETQTADYTVVWYKDAAGVPVNVLALTGADISADRKTITFPMPLAATEIWISTGLELDLAKHPVAFTSTGFNVALNGEHATDQYSYRGNLKIVQSNAVNMKASSLDGGTASPFKDGTTTNNYFHFKTGSDFAGRTITLQNVKQTGGINEPGNLIDDGVNARLVVSQNAQVVNINVPENASITVEGDGDEQQDYFYVYTPSSAADDNAAIGRDDDVPGTSSNTRSGDITLRNLRVLCPYHSVLAYSRQATSSVFTMENCTLNNHSEYAYEQLAVNFSKVVLNNCVLSYKARSGHSGAIVSGITNMEITDSQITQETGSTTGATLCFFNGVTGTLTMTRSSYAQTSKSGTANLYSVGYKNMPANVILNDGSSIASDRRLTLKNVQLNGNSSLKIDDDAETGGETVLFCSNLTVNDGTVQADNIVLSGYYTGDVANKTAVLANLAAGTVTDAGTLTLNKGTVTVSNFVGGALNAEINANGGTLSAKKIGTSGELYGYAKYIPNKGEEYFYTTSVYTSAVTKSKLGAVVNVNGATVNVAQGGYIGGADSTVNVTAGQVTLAPGSVMGMNEEQEAAYLDYKRRAATVSISGTGKVEHSGTCDTATPENGSIRAPYGTVTISGQEAGVHVHNLTADHGGTITIEKTGKTYYDNPHAGAVINDPKINVLVDQTLEAGTLISMDNAVVFANYVYLYPAAGQVGKLDAKITSKVYVGTAFGKNPDSQGGYQLPDYSASVIVGAEQKGIVYHLQEMCNFTDTYVPENPNPNTYTYDAANKNPVQLAAPTWKGRKFVKWYTDADRTEPVPETGLPVNDVDGHHVYAEWEYDKVPFSITIDTDVNGFTLDEVANMNGYKHADGKTYTFNHVAEIPYGTVIETGLDLANKYTMKTLQVSSFKFAEPSFASQTPGYVIQGLYELYLEKLAKNQLTKISDTEERATIELKATGTIQRRLLLTLDLNRANGKPVDAAFPGHDGVAVLQGQVETGETVAEATALLVNDELITPVAEGYDFLGWYANKEGTGTHVQLTDKPEDHTTYYAKWQPKTYLITFDAQSNGQLTIGSDKPVGGEPKTIAALATYDAPLKDMRYATQMNAEWSAATNAAGGLPFAWTAGKAFIAWHAGVADGKIINGDTCLNKTELGEALTVSSFATATETGWIADEAAKFAAEYQTPTYVFHANEGRLKVQQNGETVLLESHSQQVEGGQAFPGFAEASLSSGYYEEVATDADFRVLSTTVNVFAANHNVHLQYDYRHAVQRKGYTFLGWFESEAKAAEAKRDATGKGTPENWPTQTTIHLYAGWAPNTYTVDLRTPTHTTHSSYLPDTNTNASEVVKGATLIVGETVSTTIGQTNWPERTSWYAYNKGEDAPADNLKRYLLGFTFSDLDPGSSTKGSPGYNRYQDYAKEIALAANSGCLFTKAEDFKIPTTEYTLSEVPDYPHNASFSLYAVYRERSLVFEEFYNYQGKDYITVLHSGPVSEYSTYPDTYQSDPNGHYSWLTAKEQGYALQGWYVNNSEQTKYPKDDPSYQAMLETYTGAAEGADVIVRTIYTANVEEVIPINASTNPTAPSTTVYTKIPGSMKSAKAQYQIDLSGTNFHLVSADEMQQNTYSAKWGNNCTANNTAAITMTVKGDGRTVTGDLEAGKIVDIGDSDSDISAIGSNYEIALTMYHSAVISEEQVFMVPVRITYPTESEQSYTMNLQITLTPPNYKVNWRAELPRDAANLKVTATNGFALSKDGEAYEKTAAAVPYGSQLPDQSAVPQIEGYTWKGSWKTQSGQELNNGIFLPSVTEADKGTVTLVGDYQINQHHLYADVSTRSLLAIPVMNNSDEAAVEYAKKVFFSGSPTRLYITKGTGETAVKKTLAEWIEDGFVTVADTDTYSFLMPDMDVTLQAYQDYPDAQVTLTASETGTVLAANEVKTKTYDFTQNNVGKVLAGKNLYLVSAEPAAITGGTAPRLDNWTAVETVAKTAGSDYANQTFGFELAFDTAAQLDAASLLAAETAQPLGMVTAASQLTLTLHNANAITNPTTAGTYTFVFSTSPTGGNDAHNITITVTVNRKAANLNVTVPLVMVMQTNIDGGTASVQDDEYAIDNHSTMRVQLTNAQVRQDNPSVIQQATAQEAADLGNQRDKFVIAFKTDCTNKNLYAPDTPDGQNGTKASSYNPLNYVSVSPLTFVTTDDPDEGLHMATITYTVAIPEKDE